MKDKTLPETSRCLCGNRASDCMCPIEAAQMERRPLTATEINRREDAHLAFYTPDPWDMFE